MKLVVVLIVMLVTSQVFYILYALLGRLVYINYDPDTTETSRKLNLTVDSEYACYALSNIFFCVPHWIFAFKYWVISRRIKTIEQDHVAVRN
jgi:hypothetical protein